MKKFIDVKVTSWERYYFNDDSYFDKIRQELENGLHPFDLSYEDGFQYTEKIIEADEYIEPVENNGASTIEMYENNKMIYSNK